MSHPESPLKQIGKTISGAEVEEWQLNLIASQVNYHLGLKSSDFLMDIGCGNGLLTVRYSKIVNKVIGLDFTEGLLNYAQLHNQSMKVNYINSDILKIDQRLLTDVNVLVMYEVLQHLNLEEFSTLLSKLNILKPGAQFFIGGIPNKEKIKCFYNTDDKYSYYLSCEREGRPHLGRWWIISELNEIALNHGWLISYIPQHVDLYTSYYRFDVLLVKK